jgi:hypothetical protein
VKVPWLRLEGDLKQPTTDELMVRTAAIEQVTKKAPHLTLP